MSRRKRQGSRKGSQRAAEGQHLRGIRTYAEKQEYKCRWESCAQACAQAKISMNPSAKEIEILENLYNSPNRVSQRDLARIAGLSLGMTNTILKRLAQKGWVTVRKVNNRNIHYAVTPSGVDLILRKSYRYFKRTIKNVVYYREAIEKLIKEAGSLGYTQVMLIGRSDLDFIVEHACSRYEVPLLHTDPEEDQKKSTFYLYAETIIPDNEEQERETAPSGAAYLQNVLIQ